MRTQIRIEVQFCEGFCNPIFGKGCSEVFKKLFARLRESDPEERFKLFVIQTALFLYQKHGGGHLGGRNERFGFYLETERGLPDARSQYGESGKCLLSGFGSELDGNFLLNHDQYGPALFILESFQYDIGCNIVGEVRYQMIRLIQQSAFPPTLKHISAAQFETTL